jgi:hypothetical protein
MMLVMTTLLELVLGFAAHKGAGKSANDTVTGLATKQATA